MGGYPFKAVAMACPGLGALRLSLLYDVVPRPSVAYERYLHP